MTTKLIIVLIALLSVSCSRLVIGPTGPTGDTGANGQDGATGPAGTNGVDGQDGSNGTDGANGVDGTDGINGVAGQQGPQGAPGIDANPITVVTLCPAVTTYPGTFTEVAFCIQGKLYATYSANGGFSTEIPPGTYSSNGINSSCTFVVAANCQVTAL